MGVPRAWNQAEFYPQPPSFWAEDALAKYHGSRSTVRRHQSHRLPPQEDARLIAAGAAHFHRHKGVEGQLPRSPIRSRLKVARHESFNVLRPPTGHHAQVPSSGVDRAPSFATRFSTKCPISPGQPRSGRVLRTRRGDDLSPMIIAQGRPTLSPPARRPISPVYFEQRKIRSAHHSPNKADVSLIWRSAHQAVHANRLSRELSDRRTGPYGGNQEWFSRGRGPQRWDWVAGPTFHPPTRKEILARSKSHSGARGDREAAEQRAERERKLSEIRKSKSFHHQSQVMRSGERSENRLIFARDDNLEALLSQPIDRRRTISETQDSSSANEQSDAEEARRNPPDSGRRRQSRRFSCNHCGTQNVIETTTTGGHAKKTVLDENENIVPVDVDEDSEVGDDSFELSAGRRVQQHKSVQLVAPPATSTTFHAGLSRLRQKSRKFFRSQSRARLLNSEEMVKLANFRRFLFGAGIGYHELIDRVQALRKAARRAERRAERKAATSCVVDEDGLPEEASGKDSSKSRKER